MALNAGDLKHLVDSVFEVDSFKSKMGNDADIVVLSFSVLENNAAKDLVSFLEKGYPFVLDADATAGEQSDGTYKVFVELERTREVPGQITEIVDGVQKLANLDRPRFRYYKNFKSLEATAENLEETIPVDPDLYSSVVSESNLTNYKNFFNRSYVESVDMLGDILSIKKKFAEPLKFQMLEFGDRDSVYNNINESLNFNDFAEVIFLSKYIGDYNISKYGDSFIFENEDKALVIKKL
jgi:hypothetical protein